MRWETRQPAPAAWVCALPRCPGTLDEARDSPRFRVMGTANRYHRDGSVDARSRTGARSVWVETELGTHSNQCIYATDGTLDRSSLYAGTADLGAFGSGRHVPLDVAPFRLALHLDLECGGGTTHRDRYIQLRPRDAELSALCGRG